MLQIDIMYFSLLDVIDFKAIHNISNIVPRDCLRIHGPRKYNQFKTRWWSLDWRPFKFWWFNKKTNLEYILFKKINEIWIDLW